MLHHSTPRNIILGSQSPRRRELMAGLDIPFTCVTIDADESYPADLQAGGRQIFYYKGKCDIETNGNYILFEDEQGLRQMIYWGITDTIIISELPD